jgi:guanine deaminase
VLGHGIHLSNEELELLHQRGARIAHCPQSNLFLGSGLFNLSRAAAAGVVVGLGSDVGGGWTLSMPQTAASCYQVQALLGTFYSASELLYLITRGGALALGESSVGAFEPKMEADFVVHRVSNDKDLDLRLKTAQSPEEVLAAFLFLTTRHCVEKVYVAGRRVI